MYKYLTAEELTKKIEDAARIKAALPQYSPEMTKAEFANDFVKHVSGGTEMPYTICVRIWDPKDGEGIFNELELTAYTNQNKGFHAKGTAGEEWVIPFKNLVKYEKLDGTPLTEEDLKDEWLVVRRTTNYTYLAKSDKAIVVCDGWGTDYYCPEGSFVACGVSEDGTPDLGYFWVINSEIVKGTNKPVVE